MITTKRTKSDIEKKYITLMWVQRRRYNAAKEDFDSLFGCYQDKERMRKAKREMKRLRVELSKVRLSRAA